MVSFIDMNTKSINGAPNLKCNLRDHSQTQTRLTKKIQVTCEARREERMRMRVFALFSPGTHE
jgi:hypothetical protein